MRGFGEGTFGGGTFGGTALTAPAAKPGGVLVEERGPEFIQGPPVEFRVAVGWGSYPTTVAASDRWDVGISMTGVSRRRRSEAQRRQIRTAAVLAFAIDEFGLEPGSTVEYGGRTYRVEEDPRSPEK